MTEIGNLEAVDTGINKSLKVVFVQIERERYHGAARRVNRFDQCRQPTVVTLAPLPLERAIRRKVRWDSEGHEILFVRCEFYSGENLRKLAFGVHAQWRRRPALLRRVLCGGDEAVSAAAVIGEIAAARGKRIVRHIRMGVEVGGNNFGIADNEPPTRKRNEDHKGQIQAGDQNRGQRNTAAFGGHSVQRSLTLSQQLIDARDCDDNGEPRKRSDGGDNIIRCADDYRCRRRQWLDRDRRYRPIKMRVNPLQGKVGACIKRGWTLE